MNTVNEAFAKELVSGAQKIIHRQAEEIESLRIKNYKLIDGFKDAAKLIRNGQFEAGIQMVDVLLEGMK
jgi:hypothetical protein